MARNARGEPGGDGIAIVGLDCLFPAAEGVDAYWANILGAVDTIGEPPAAWGAERYLKARDERHIRTSAGGFLGDLYRVDPARLGVMPSSIDGGEPDQFLALRLARGALADAGYLDDDYDHTRTGIILGHSTYLHRGSANLVQHGVVIDQTVTLVRQLLPEIDDGAAAELRATLSAKLPPLNTDITPGLVPNVLTGRIANRLDFQGPNYVIDAACASSLLAVQTAMEELRAGRSDLMLAGGVNASTPAEAYIIFSQLGALSAHPRVRPFSTGTDGTLLGEGVGILVLKRLADAQRDGDRIYAVLKAVGQSSDGRALGLLAPRREGEALAIRRAHEEGRIDPGTIGLIEAHGTGIPLGDKTEIAALTDVFGARAGALPLCALGSVKSMIGHCIPAAGAAGLIKTALALYYKVLPPSLCDEVNPDLGLEKSPFYINTEPQPWIQPLGAPRRAAVNAFGFGGVNSHAVLEEAPEGGAPEAVAPEAVAPEAVAPEVGASPRAKRWPSELIALDAPDREALLARIAALEARLDKAPDAPLAVLGRALVEAIGQGRFRLAIIAGDVADLRRKAAKAREHLAGGGPLPYRARSGIFMGEAEAEPGKLAFVFPGEGAQHEGMLADLLMCFPEARRWFDFWDTIYDGERDIPPSRCVFPPPSALDEASRKSLHARLFGLEIGSEAMFIGSQALLQVVRALKLEPDAMVGHSSGENSALVASRVIVSEGWTGLKRLIVKLNAIYRAIEESKHVTGGVLLTVGAVERDRILELVDDEKVFLALDNCHHQAVLYGARTDMEAVAAILRAEGGLCAFLPIDRPYHTPLFAPIIEAVQPFYDAISFAAPAVPVYSCATAQPFPADQGEIRRLAAGQWRARVRFTETIARMYADGFRTFVEVGPASNLTGFIEDILRTSDVLAVALDNRKRASVTQLLTALARVWVRGHSFALAELFAHRGLASESGGEEDGARLRPIANTLPFVRLSDEEAAAFRARIARTQAPGAGPRGPGNGGSHEPPQPPQPPAQAYAAAPTFSSAGAGDLAPAMVSATAGLSGTPLSGTPLSGARNSGARISGDIIANHFAIMRSFLADQEQILDAALTAPEALPEALGDDDDAWPFLHRIIEQDADHLLAEYDAVVAEQPYLRQHILYASHISDLDPGLHGLSVVPLAVSLELVAEAAGALAGDLILDRLENVRAHNWLALDEGARVLRLAARRIAAGDGEARFAARITDGPEVLFEAEVVFAAEPTRTAPALPALVAPQAPVWRDEELYTTGMFHGPIYHSVRALRAWDDTGLDATLNDTPLDDFVRPGRRPRFFLNPVLLDAIGHVTAFWIAQRMGTDFSSFPSRIARIDLPGAWREDTAGAVLGGRLDFERASNGDARFLTGAFECVAADGSLLFRAEGWRDRFFEVPNRFFFARYNPREGWYGEDCTALLAGAPADLLLWWVPAFPPGFLEDAGAIWKRVLAHTVLSAEDRATWEALPRNPKRRTDWLMGRVAAKEAGREFIAAHAAGLLLPADLTVRGAEGGKPFLAPEGLEDIGDLPEISIAHSRGHALAAVAPPGVAVGVDLEFLEGAATADLRVGGFSEAERGLLDSGSESQTALRTLAAWCAKEAAAKCAGEGLNGRPTALVLTALDIDAGAGEARVEGFGRRFRVWIATHEGAVLAAAIVSHA